MLRQYEQAEINLILLFSMCGDFPFSNLKGRLSKVPNEKYSEQTSCLCHDLDCGTILGWESGSVFLPQRAVTAALGSNLQRSVGGRGGWMPAAHAAVEMVGLCTPTLQHHLSHSER